MNCMPLHSLHKCGIQKRVITSGRFLTNGYLDLQVIRKVVILVSFDLHTGDACVCLQRTFESSGLVPAKLRSLLTNNSMDGESAWGIKPGAASWAEDVENEEARIGGPLKDEEAFPSLGEAVKAGAGKGAKTSKKGKPLKMGLNDFLAAPSRRTAESDKELLMKLPKGSSGLPREERDPNALGGAFKDYGGERGELPYHRCTPRRARSEQKAPASADIVLTCKAFVACKTHAASNLYATPYRLPASSWRGQVAQFVQLLGQLHCTATSFSDCAGGCVHACNA